MLKSIASSQLLSRLAVPRQRRRSPPLNLRPQRVAAVPKARAFGWTPNPYRYRQGKPAAADREGRRIWREVTAQFQVWGEDLLLKDFEDERVIAYLISEGSGVVRADALLSNRQFSILSSWCNTDISGLDLLH